MESIFEFSADALRHDNFYMTYEFLEKMKELRTKPFEIINGENYICTEYKLKVNLLSFKKFNFSLSFNVIGLPLSVNKPGFSGDLNKLLEDYKKRRGLFLMLNLSEPIPNYACGKTLDNFVFYNSFDSFSQYIDCLRSSYRRRINVALKKLDNLVWKKIKNSDFDVTMYGLYLNVVEHSDFPLETLKMKFFRNFDAEIYCLYENDEPIAFIQLKDNGESMDFILGGMNYNKRDKYDLYYNMLIKILKIGIKRKVKAIDFGQTADKSKLRLGCVSAPKYLTAFTRNKLINVVFKLIIKFLDYKSVDEVYHVFKIIRR